MLPGNLSLEFEGARREENAFLVILVLKGRCQDERSEVNNTIVLKKMKQMMLAMCLSVAGCAIPQPAPMGFADAVRASVREYGGHEQIVLDLQPNGSFTIAGRATEVVELSDIASVFGVPQPLRVLIEVHKSANQEAIQNLSDMCRSNGVDIMIVKGIFKGKHNKE